MPNKNGGETCVLCGQGPVVKGNQEVAFRQLTDKGYVFCRVTVELGICAQCGGISSDANAKAIMDEAVRKEYDKLP